jgi:hypothetical protein
VVLYAVGEWCTQIHLWSIEFAKAMRGMRCVRRVRGYIGGAACAIAASLRGGAQLLLRVAGSGSDGPPPQLVVQVDL